MRLGADHVRVRVPATSANLGPGFDAFGIALGLYDELEVRALASPGVTVEVTGEGAGQVPDDEQHLVVSSLRAALDLVGASQTGLHLVCRNRIPHGRGLGSSAGAVVAGIVAARGLIADPDALSDDVALDLAARIEGSLPTTRRPRCSAARRWPGATTGSGRWTSRSTTTSRCSRSSRRTTSRRRPPAGSCPRRCRMPTPRSRRAGRRCWSRPSAGDPSCCLAATQDRLHQEYRRAVMPGSLALVDVLRAQGVAAVVSGAGPTVLVLARRLARADGATDADEAVRAAFGGAMGGWQVLSLPVDREGATVQRAT